MDRPPRADRHLPGPERPLLSIRLTRGLRTGDSSHQQARSLLELALSGHAVPESGSPYGAGAEFANFLDAAVPQPEEGQENSPRVYQHYELLPAPAGGWWVLGQGAMGITYKARDTNLHCEVALKVINPRYLSDPTARERFLREARAAAGLRHPNIAGIYHLGFRGEDAFYAMEFIAGVNLAEHVKRHGPLGATAALEVAEQVALALTAAHRKGFLHRDIKPTNLMLVTGEDETPERPTVKVIDFGLVTGMAGVKPADEDAAATGYFIGTPCFASPEQFAHRPLDARTDLYSLGATLFYLLTGETPPAPGGTLPARQALPTPVASLLEALLQEDAAARPRDAAEVARRIERCRAEIGTAAVHSPRTAGDGPPAVDRKPTRGRRWMIGVWTAAAVIFFGGAQVVRSRFFHPTQVAVLPLVNLTGDPTLAENIVGDLRHALTKRNTFEVVPPAPGAGGRDRPGRATLAAPPPEGVRWVFTGSIWRKAEMLEIDMRLVDARTGRAAWGNAYKYCDLVDSAESIRADVARKIAADLQGGALPGLEGLAGDQPVPLEASTELAQGQVYYQKSTRQDNQRTVACCQRALTLAPDLARAHALLARAYCQSHVHYGGGAAHLALAQASAERAIQLAPDQPEGHNALALVQLVQGQQWQALAENRRAVEASPGYWPALRDYGTIWIMLGHPERGLPWLRAACAIEPWNSGCRCYLADAYADLCDDDNAERSLREALSIDPGFRTATGAGIHLCMLQGRWDQARRLCDEALAVGQGTRSIRQLRAQIDLLTGDYARAESRFRDLLASDPTGSPMFYGGMRHASVLGFLRRQQGDDTEGNRLLAQAAEMDGQAGPEGPQSLYDLAATRAAQDRSQEGLESLRKACAAGWLDFRSLKLDPRFGPLRTDPGFQKLVADLDGKVAALRHAAQEAQNQRVRLADYPTGPAASER